MASLGVCSWSLRPPSPAALRDAIVATGLDRVQLALDPIRRGDWDERETLEALRNEGIRIVSGMMAMAGEDYSSLEAIRRTGGIRPDSTWAANRAAAVENARIAARIGVRLVTLHAGFVTHDAHDPERGVMIQRLGELAGIFDGHGVAVALETGQESAATLESLLEDLGGGIGINFDPGNMILYGMGDPVEAFARLAPRVRQIHIKDAIPSTRPGEWGTEVPVGQGGVDWPAFFGVYSRARLHCDLLIEREAGENRIADILAARQVVQMHLTPIEPA